MYSAAARDLVGPCDDSTGTAPRGPAWIVAFAAQATTQLRAQVLRYARRRARMLAWSGGRTDPHYARELVHDVLSDTFTGRLTWDAARVSLRDHVCAAIRSRTGHERARLERFPHAALDDVSETDPLVTEVEEALRATTPRVSSDEKRRTSEVIARVRQLATDDAEVLAMLDAMIDGIRERADLAAETGMSLRRYDAARRRLDRMLDALPQRLAPARTIRRSSARAA